MRAESILQDVDTSLLKRKTAAAEILKSPQALKQAVDIIVQQKELSLKALLVLEVIGRDHFFSLYKYIPNIIRSGKSFERSAARRCLAKLYGVAIAYDKTFKGDFQLGPELKKEIIEQCFLWLVASEKTAVKVFSMQNLFDLKEEERWISAELKAILQKDIITSSAGYKSRATKILRKL